MDYSSEDCKKYLVTIYTDTEQSGWKRIKKYNDEQKRVARDFEYKDGRKATILETPEGLKDKTLIYSKAKAPGVNNPFAKIRQQNTHNHSQSKPSKIEEDFQLFMQKVLQGIDGQNNQNNIGYNNYNTPNNNTPESPKSSVEMMKDYLKQQEQDKIKQKAQGKQDMSFNDIFADMPEILQQAILSPDSNLNQLVQPKENIVTNLLKNIDFSEVNTHEEKFLYVLVNGTQWQQPEGNQASTDFYEHIVNKEEFLTNLTSKCVNLPDMYVTHILNTAATIESMDEGYVPFHVMQGQEALKDMCSILIDMVTILESNNIQVQFDKDLIQGCIYTLEGVKSHCSMNEAGDMWEKQDIDNEIDTLINFIKSKSPKKGMKP